MAKPPRCLRFSARAYRSLLAAYPDSFRQRFGEEMVWVFDELANEAWRRRGVAGLATTWCRVLADMARTVPREHWNLWKGGSEMKTAAAAVLSVLLAVVIQYFVFVMVLMTIGAPLIVGIGQRSVAAMVPFCLSPFLTGMILTRVKPFVMPKITATLGAMLFVSPVVFSEGGTPWWIGVGAVAAVGLLTFLGCFVATKASGRLDRISVPATYWVGTLAVFVCTFSVGCILWLVRSATQLDPVMDNGLIVCMFLLYLVAAATVANLIVFVVRTRKRTELNRG